MGLVAEFPSLSWLAPTEDEALHGIIKVVEQIAADDPRYRRSGTHAGVEMLRRGARLIHLKGDSPP